jgi:hypothetical protein
MHSDGLTQPERAQGGEYARAGTLPLKINLITLASPADCRCAGHQARHKPMERKRDPTPRCRRFCHHPRAHGGIAPRARGGAGYRKRIAAGPTDAPLQKPALAATSDWRRVGAGPPIRFRRRLGREGGLAGAKRRKRLLLSPRSHKRIGRLRPSISAPVAQQPGTPEPPGTPPQPPPDPTAPRPYEEPPRPIPIPRPDEPPVVDDPPPRRNA